MDITPEDPDNRLGIESPSKVAREFLDGRGLQVGYRWATAMATGAQVWKSPAVPLGSGDDDA